MVNYNLTVRFTMTFGTNIEENTAINYMKGPYDTFMWTTITLLRK